MKLRLNQNSIRFRLGQSDVQRLRDSGCCQETVLFPGGARLGYVLRASSQLEPQVSFSYSQVSVAVPEQTLTNWHSSSEVGIYAAVDVQPGKKLEVLIEKDFKCLDPRVPEDQSDGFENPLNAHLGCEAPV